MSALDLVHIASWKCSR